MSSTSVIRSRALLRSPKSILRRPSPLPLSPSPFPFSTSFNVLLSVSARSPHVHFPPSPALFATFTTHSANTYDRGPFPVSPSVQPDALTVTSPSLSGFRLSDPPKRNKTKTPTLFQHQDPRSPRPVAMQSFAAAMSIGSKPRTELKKALTHYPMSPYPSAPVSPVIDLDLEVIPLAEEKEIQNSKKRGRASSAPSRVFKKRSNTSDGVRTLSRPTQEEKPENITFQLTSSRRLAPPHLDLTAARLQPFLTPVQESSTVENTPFVTITAPDSTTADDLDGLSDASSGESTRLSNAFWQSVSIEVEDPGPIQFGGFPGSGGASSDGGFPESVTGSQASDSEDIMMRGLFSPRPGMIPRTRMPALIKERMPTLTFGKSDGSIWSPSSANEPLSFASIMGDEGVNTLPLVVPRNAFTAPTPNDPFAKFPSFAAVLEADNTGSNFLNSSVGIVDSVQVPPQVHLP